ncbi:MAG: hypothetical protein AB6733_13305 [Clostridiaceae bacterium]
MNYNGFNKYVLNIISIPLIILSLFFYYKVEFSFFLTIAIIVVLINFSNYWYIYWTLLVLSGPILSNIFFTSTLGNMSRTLISNFLFLFWGLILNFFMVSIVRHYSEYIKRKQLISTYRKNLNHTIELTLKSLSSTEIDFSQEVSPLSYKTNLNEETKAKIVKDFSSKLEDKFKTIRFKDILLGTDNQSLLSSLKNFLEVKDLLKNFRLKNPNSVMSVFKDIEHVFKENNILLDDLEKVFKSMDYEVLAKLQDDFSNNYNKYVINPKDDPFIKKLIDHTNFRYIESLQVTNESTSLKLEDIIVTDSGVFLVEEYHDSMNMHNLKVDINGVWVKFYNSGEIEIDKQINTSITSKALLLEKVINSNLSGKKIEVTPIVILDHKGVSIENQSKLKIISSEKLEKTIRKFDQKLPQDVFNSVSSTISSLIPELPTYEEEFPSPNIINLIELGLYAMTLVNQLHEILLIKTEGFINKYKP